MNNLVKDRILGCLKGLAVGDAIGKQTETLNFEEIKSWYPNGVNGFEGTIGKEMPRYINSHYPWKFGETTDDTEQTIAVAESIIQSGKVSHSAVGEKLMLCKKSNRPTLQLGKFQMLGDINRIAYDGDGCGASMRIASIAIIHSSDNLKDLVYDVFESSIPTHGGNLAICAASSIASAISAAIDEKSPTEILQISIAASKEAQKYRNQNSDVNYEETLINMYNDLAAQDEIDINYLNKKYFPKTTINIVPLAISLALITKSAEKAALISANLGGDSDSVASMSSAIAGAMFPNTVNNTWYEAIQIVNNHNLEDLATKLYFIRNNMFYVLK